MNKVAIGTYGLCPIKFLQSNPTKNQICCYIALASFQGNNENSWPSLSEIAVRAFGSTSKTRTNAASTAIQELVKTGWITRTRRRNSSSIYTCSVDVRDFGNPNDSGESENSGNPSDSGGGNPSHSGGGNPSHSGTKRTIKRTIEKNNCESSEKGGGIFSGSKEKMQEHKNPFNGPAQIICPPQEEKVSVAKKPLTGRDIKPEKNEALELARKLHGEHLEMGNDDWPKSRWPREVKAARDLLKQYDIIQINQKALSLREKMKSDKFFSEKPFSPSTILAFWLNLRNLNGTTRRSSGRGHYIETSPGVYEVDPQNPPWKKPAGGVKKY